MQHQPSCQAHAPPSSHSWTRSWYIWLSPNLHGAIQLLCTQVQNCIEKKANQREKKLNKNKITMTDAGAHFLHAFIFRSATLPRYLQDCTYFSVWVLIDMSSCAWVFSRNYNWSFVLDVFIWRWESSHNFLKNCSGAGHDWCCCPGDIFMVFMVPFLYLP